jgi:type IV fimbrial biogenesis protein FimT
MRRAAGYTLAELLLTTTIIGVAVGLGVPALGRFGQDLRLTAATNGFVSAVQLARSEAAKRRQPVIMCNSADGIACTGGVFDSGWIVFANADDARPPSRDPAEPLLLDFRPAGDALIRSNRRLFEFRPFLQRSTNGSVTFCDARGPAHARVVIVSYTGRPRVAAANPSNPPPCPTASQ